MALLSPITKCKVTDANAFLTPLGSFIGHTTTAVIRNGTPSVANLANFSRTEALSKILLFIGVPTAPVLGTITPNPLTVVLGQYKTATMTLASPTLVTTATHGYTTGDAVRFTSTGNMYTGITRGQKYYVNVQSTTTFWIYDTYANAIAGGATGQVNTSGSQSGVHSCHLVMEEKVITCDDVFGESTLPQTSSQTFANYMSTGWTTTVDNVANKWSLFYVCDDADTANQWNIMHGTAQNGFIAYGTTVQSATSGTDGIIFDQEVDMTGTFVLKSHRQATETAGICGILCSQKDDPYLTPNFIIDPTQGTAIGNTTIDGRFIYSALSYMSIGKPIRFTANLLTGATSGTLSANFDGVTGSYLVHLNPVSTDDEFQQVTMSFTNGSTSVTFSALTSNGLADAGVCVPHADNYDFYAGAQTVGTASFTSLTNIVSSTAMGFRMNCFGEVVKEPYAVLDADVASGTNTIVTDRETNWEINDTLKVGGNDTQIGGDNTTYTISNISTSGGKDTITLSANLATYNRKAGNQIQLVWSSTTAINFNKHANVNNYQLTFNPSIFNVIGVNTTAWSALSYAVGNNGGTNIFTDRKPYFLYYVSDFVVLFIIPTSGTRAEKISMTTKTVGNVQIENAGATIATSKLKNLAFYNTAWIGGTYVLPIGVPLIVDTLYTETPSSNGAGLDLILNPNMSVKNIHIWGLNNPYGAWIKANFSRQMENIYIDNAKIGIQVSSFSVGSSAGTPIGAKMKNVYFGTKQANTVDVAFTAGSYSDLEINNPTNYTISTTNQALMVEGSLVKMTDINGVQNETMIYHKNGRTSISGTGLSDTTAHNSNQVMKFLSESGVDQTQWTQTIPTGNIQNKDMMIGVWVNIDNAGYWGGSHQMPRLTINYDDGTEAYAEAGQVTGWQYIFVPFTPTTTSSFVTAKLSTQTDAGANGYVYMGDMSVLYPAGYTLNLGSFNYLNAGFPVAPTISTSVSAQDVWSADPTQFGVNTVGDKVNKIKNDTGIIPALL